MEFEAFRVIAQIAAGLAGFVGIILVMQDRLERLPRRQILGFLQGSVGMLGYGDFRKMPPIQAAVCVASLPVIGAKLLVGAGMLSAYASNIYHLGLLWTVGVSIFFFVQVVLNEAKADS